jgi:cold shock protein
MSVWASDSSPQGEAKMAEGTIKKLTDKGFGFIKVGDGKDLFFHSSSVGVIRRFKTGQRIGASKPAGTVESSSELLRLASGCGLDSRVLPL